MNSANFPRRKEEKRKEAKERDAFALTQTHQQKLANLDRKFGKGVGAKKERARLQKWIESTERNSK